MSALAKEGFYSEDAKPKDARLVVMSLEGRANIIADAVNRVEHAGNPDKRRQAVYDEALAQMRAAVAIGSLRHLADDRPEDLDAHPRYED